MENLPPIPVGQKRCPSCLALHPNRKFSYCKPCRSVYVKKQYSYEAKRDAHLRRTYGITLDEYNLLFFKQGGLCAICGHPEWITDPYTKQTKWLVLDHNHETGAPRELLCHRCNIVLGELETDRRVINKMLRYLKKHESV
jgi:Recombination endonuclease VII